MIIDQEARAYLTKIRDVMRSIVADVGDASWCRHCRLIVEDPPEHEEGCLAQLLADALEAAEKGGLFT